MYILYNSMHQIFLERHKLCTDPMNKINRRFSVKSQLVEATFGGLANKFQMYSGMTEKRRISHAASTICFTDITSNDP